jgi:Nif-specific regulatory protein
MKDLHNEQDTLKYHMMVYERFLITDALRKAKGNCARAARILGTTERIINYKVRKYEIDYRQFRKKDPGPAAGY